MNWFWKVLELTYFIGEGIKYLNKIHTIPGKIFFIASAAVSALGLPPCRQSSNWNNVCLTGLEYDTLPLSTRVIFLTPQPYKHNNCEQVLQKFQKVRSIKPTNDVHKNSPNFHSVYRINQWYICSLICSFYYYFSKNLHSTNLYVRFIHLKKLFLPITSLV